MQIAGTRAARRRRDQAASSETRRALLRAVRYLGRYRRWTALAYTALVVATAAQLAVPRLVQRIIDTLSLIHI